MLGPKGWPYPSKHRGPRPVLRSGLHGDTLPSARLYSQEAPCHDAPRCQCSGLDVTRIAGMPLKAELVDDRRPTDGAAHRQPRGGAGGMAPPGAIRWHVVAHGDTRNPAKRRVFPPNRKGFRSPSSHRRNPRSARVSGSRPAVLRGAALSASLPAAATLTLRHHEAFEYTPTSFSSRPAKRSPSTSSS